MQKGLAHHCLTDNQRGRTNWGQALALPFFFAKERTFLDYSISRSLKKNKVTKLPVATPLYRRPPQQHKKVKVKVTRILALQRSGDSYFLDLNQKDICTNIARGRTDPRVKSFCQSNCKNVCNKLLKLILAVVKLLLGCQLIQSYHQPFLNIRNNTTF